MSRVHGPRAVADGDAYMWTVDVDAVPHLIAWCPSDGGSLRLSFPTSNSEWSPFVRMGSAFSPRRTVGEAATAVHEWSARRGA